MVDRKNEFISRKGLLDAICEEKGKQEMGSDVHSLSAVCEMRPGDCNMSARSVKRCRFLFSLPPFLNGYAACNTSREQIFIWAYYQLHQQYYFAIIHSFVRRKLQKKMNFAFFFFMKRMGNIARHNMWDSGGDQHHDMKENWYLANSIMGRQSRNTVQREILAPPQLKADAVITGRRRCLGDGLPS